MDDRIPPPSHLQYSPSPVHHSSPHHHLNSMRYSASERERYLAELLAERQKLAPFVQVLPFCTRLLNQEILRASSMPPNHNFVDAERIEHGSPLRLPGHPVNGQPMDLEGWSGMQTEHMGVLQASPMSWNGAPALAGTPVVKKLVRLDVPVDKYPNFNFVGRLLGPRGNSLKRVEATTQCRVYIRGRGSVKDSVKEEKLRDKPGYEHLNEALHVLVEAEFPADIIDARLNQAVTILEDLLKPIDEAALHYLSGPYGDTTYTKVFVGGLAWETRSEGLRAHFEVYGDILEAVVITDRATGRSKGYGFVTFRDPESARMACMDPYPVIDGRRANCNLAILGRPGPAVPFSPIRPVMPFNGGAAVPGSMYVPSPTYQQSPYNYSQAVVYPPYGPSTYGPEYLYPQNAYGPYVGQQYVPVYGGPRTLGPAVYPYGQFGQPVPSDQSYSPGYLPGHLLPLSNQNAANVRASTVQQQYPPGAPRSQQQLLLPARAPQFPPNNNSEQMSG